MADFTDEDLMAYADGELEQARAEKIRAALGTRPDLAARVELFSRTRRLTKEAGLAAPGATVPPALAARVEQMIAQAGRPATDDVMPMPRPPVAAGNDNRKGWWATALAASVAAVLAGAAGYWGGVSRGGGVSADMVLAGPVSGPLATALSRVPSGSEEALGDGTRVVIVASFEDAARTLCREFEMSAGNRVHAVACWRDGGWTTELAMRTANDGTQYVPASGAATVDAFLGSIGADVALEAEQEGRLLEGLAR